MVHTTVTTALSGNWKKSTTGIRLCVSKLYATFFLWCCSETEDYGDCLLRFPDHTQLDTDTIGRTFPNEYQLVAVTATYTKSRDKGQWPCCYWCTNTICYERNRCRYTAQTARPFVSR